LRDRERLVNEKNEARLPPSPGKLRGGANIYARFGQREKKSRVRSPLCEGKAIRSTRGDYGER